MTVFTLWTSKKAVVFLDHQKLFIQIIEKGRLIACHETSFLPMDEEILKNVLSQFSSYPVTLFLHDQHMSFQHVRSQSLNFWQKRKLLFDFQRQDFAFGRRLKKRFLSIVTLEGTLFQQKWVDYLSSCSNDIESCRSWVMDYVQQKDLQTGWQLIQTKTPTNQAVFVALKEGNPLFVRPFSLEKREQEIKMTAHYLFRYGFTSSDTLNIQEKPCLDLWRLPCFLKIHIPSIKKMQRQYKIKRYARVLSSYVTVIAFIMGGMEAWQGFFLKKEALNMHQNLPILSEKSIEYHRKFLIEMTGTIASFLPVSHYLKNLKETLPSFIVVTEIDWDSSQLRLKMAVDPEKENPSHHLINLKKSLEKKVTSSNVYIQNGILILKEKKS